MKVLNGRIRIFFEKNRIILSFVPLVLLPVAALLVITVMLYSSQAVEKSKKTLQNNTSLVARQVQDIFADAKNCSDIINLDINHSFSLLKYESNEKIRELKFRNSVKTDLDLYKAMFENLDAIHYIGADGRIMSTQGGMRESLKTEMFLDEISATGYGDRYFVKWINMSRYSAVAGEDIEYHISLVRPVINLLNLENMGYIVIDISEKDIAATYENLYEHYIIVDSDRRVVSSADKSDILSTGRTDAGTANENVSVSYISGRKYAYGNMYLQNLNWYLISEMDLKSATSDTVNILKNVVYLVLVIIILCIWIGKHLSDKQIREVERRKRKYDLDIMQAQIKPHFLYNALDLIYVLCAMGNMEEAKGSTKALADFYRLSLSGGDEIISLKNELLNVENYLTIQSRRYFDKFDFEINVSEDIYDYMIPKLTLQPLVENSIYHGLKPKEGRGHLTITGEKNGSCAVISIEDNGAGFSQEAINMLIKNDRKPGKLNFGLRSTAERLDLYYGMKAAAVDEINIDEVIYNRNLKPERKIGKNDIYIISNHMLLQTGAGMATCIIIVLPSFIK